MGFYHIPDAYRPRNSIQNSAQNRLLPSIQFPGAKQNAQKKKKKKKKGSLVVIALPRKDNGGITQYKINVK